ncbi:hypothetical protein [Zhengella mangrovi]|uniref:hypothetical protein n=1 Tax=Zhengella mangrovi TaxID=1982044 RepID=UPI0013FD3AD0|nr:hypothetical protein [Zhengella mangrovi]
MADGTAIAWYAAVCGLLSALSPSFGSFAVRLGLGAVVGVIAASVLPLLKAMMGY